MLFDYDKVDARFVLRIVNRNDRSLSRTQTGVSDTSASRSKRKLLLEGQELREQVLENQWRVCQMIFDSRTDPPPRSLKEVEELLFAVADLTNDRLLPNGRLRSWEIPYRHESIEDDGFRPSPHRPIPPNKVLSAVREFATTILTRWAELKIDPVPLAAWAEWHLNVGPLHPFYDGCGRISRSFSSLLLLRGSSLLPLFEDRNTYFAKAIQGTEVFMPHFQSCVESCRDWLSTRETGQHDWQKTAPGI